MSLSVVILSCPQDLHAHAMCEALERKGVRPRFLYTPDFPERLGLTIAIDEKGAALASHAEVKEEFGAECRSVWYRRPFFGKIPEDFDEDDRLVVERESRELRLSFFDLLCPAALWVNPLDAVLKEHRKPTQLVMAQRCGFLTPPTLVSNDPEEIVSFAKRFEGRIVYKSFNGLVPTSLLDSSLLDDREALRWTPGIYQPLIEKDYEIRVTIVGRRIFATKINSQETGRGKVDWREAQWQVPGQRSDLTFSRCKLPDSIQRACLRLMKALRLVYGALDLIVTPDGQYIFLEINPSGQFLWVDHEVGYPLLDAMAEMLLQGRCDYTWSPRTARVVFDSELLKASEERERQSLAAHVSALR